MISTSKAMTRIPISRRRSPSRATTTCAVCNCTQPILTTTCRVRPSSTSGRTSGPGCGSPPSMEAEMTPRSNSAGILDAYVVARGAAPERDFEAGPASGYAGIQAQRVALESHAQECSPRRRAASSRRSRCTRSSRRARHAARSRRRRRRRHRARPCSDARPRGCGRD